MVTYKISEIDSVMDNRVMRGIDFLLAHGVTSEQLDTVNPNRINIESVSDCVIGQLFGSYYDTHRSIGLGKSNGAVRLGFLVRYHRDGSERAYNRECAAINRAWYRALTARLQVRGKLAYRR